MAIRFTLDGIDISTDTADEAAVLIRRLRGNQQQAVPEGRRVPAAGSLPANSGNVVVSPPAGSIRINPPSTSLALATISFLRAIKDSAGRGADTDTVLRAVQAEHPKGIGSKVAMINDYLRSKHGTSDLDEIYVRTRGPFGRIWTPGPRLDEAIDVVQEVIDAQNS